MVNQASMTNNLTEGSVMRTLLSFSMPFMLSNALQAAYNIVDMIIVGQVVGSSGLSAVSIGGQLVWLLTVLAIGYSSGGQIYIAQQVGAQDHEGVRKTIGTLFSIVGIFSVCATVLGLALHGPMLRALNTPEEAYTDAVRYLMICSAGMIFVYGYNVVSAILRGMGDSKRPFYFVAVAAILNLVLDLVFVAGFGMGAAGAALATVIGQGVSFIGSIVYLYCRRESFGFDFKPASFAIDMGKLKALTSLGLPLALQSSLINVSMLFINACINVYGLTASAVYGIGQKLSNLMMIVTNAMSAAGATMYGQNLGAGKPERVSKIFHGINLVCIVFFILVAIPCMCFPTQIFRMFTADADVLAMAPRFMLTVMVMFAGFATMTAGIALVNGIGNGRLSLIIAVTDAVIARIALSLLMGKTLGMGMWGYYWGNSLAGIVSVVMGDVYYFSGAWKRRRLMVQMDD